jgi:hypothetical protein
MQQIFFLSCLVMSYLIPVIGASLSYLMAESCPGTKLASIFTVTSMMFVTYLAIMGLRVLIMITVHMEFGRDVWNHDLTYEMMVSRASKTQIAIMILAICVSFCVEALALVKLYGMI